MKVNISKKIALLVIVTCLLITIGASVIGTNLLSVNMTREVERCLQSGAYSIGQTMNLLTSKESKRDHMNAYRNKTSIDATIFEGNVRDVSTIANAEGTVMVETIWRILQNGDDYFTNDALVNGEHYFGYYIPLFVDNTCTGAVFTGMPKDRVDHEIIVGILQLIITIVIIAILSILLALYSARSIVKKINDSAAVIQELTNNNLKIDRINKYAREYDEVEIMYNRTYLFSEGLCGIISTTKDISKTLNNVSSNLREQSEAANRLTEEISLAVQNVAIGAERQAIDTQGVTESISEMGISIDTIAKDSSALLGTAKYMSDIKDDTMIDVSNVKDINNKIRTDISDMNKQIEITNHSVESIKAFVGVIQNIAEQTNLLSLNASIEAARAGDSGKGFGVVASEIRDLSEQSAKSATDIEATINTLLQNYELIIRKMGITTKNIEDQSEKINRTANSFVELEKNIQETIGQIEGISTAVDDINKNKSVIMDAVYNLSATSEENSAATEQITASIETMGEIINIVDEKAAQVHVNAEEVSDAVSIFNVES